jgi:hypothetical protein
VVDAAVICEGAMIRFPEKSRHSQKAGARTTKENDHIYDEPC